MSDVKGTMTGTVIAVLVKVGDQVSEGQDLLSIESMKMEMSISADFPFARADFIARIYTSVLPLAVTPKALSSQSFI